MENSRDSDCRSVDPKVHDMLLHGETPAPLEEIVPGSPNTSKVLQTSKRPLQTHMVGSSLRFSPRVDAVVENVFDIEIG